MPTFALNDPAHGEETLRPALTAASQFWIWRIETLQRLDRQKTLDETCPIMWDRSSAYISVDVRKIYV